MSASAAETAKQVKAPIVRVDMFKNGFAVVTHELAAEAGVAQYIIDGLQNPVHGTLWVQSEEPVTMKFFIRQEIESKQSVMSSRDILDSLIGEWVLIRLMNEEEVDGILRGVTADTQLVILESEDGTLLVKADEIMGLEADRKIKYTENKETKIAKPSILLTTGAVRRNQKITISYLTRGISWAPSYRLDLSDKNKGRLQMKTVVRNEMMSMDNAEFFLISGFPSIKFKDVSSPANANTSWAEFFASISGGSGYSGAPMMQQAMSMSNVAPRSMDMSGSSYAAPDIPSGDYDIHYLPAGRQSLQLNESLVLPLADEKIAYERVVEWNVVDNMDTYGNYLPPGSGPDGIDLQQDVWDAVKFDNPFAFPMTTASISMYQNNAFLGQSQALWTAPGQEVFTRITKAMNVKVDHTESEIPDMRKDVVISNHTYTKTQVKATVSVKNNRGRKDKIIIRRRLRLMSDSCCFFCHRSCMPLVRLLTKTTSAAQQHKSTRM